MGVPPEPFCLDTEERPDMPIAVKQRNRIIGYVVTFLTIFTLGTTEVFAPWYTGLIGGSDFEVGWAMGSFGLVTMVSPAIGGRLSDRIGRKKTLFIATSAYIGVIVLFLWPFSGIGIPIMPIYLILIRALEGLVFGFISPTVEGMVAELEPEAQCTTLGNFATSWSASMILPPIIIAYLSGVYGELSSIYVVLAVEFLALAVIGFMLHGYRRKPATEIIPEEIDTVEIVEGVSKTSPIFLASYLSIMIWGVVSTIILGLFPTYIEDLILLGYPLVREDFGNLLLIWNAVRTVGFIVIARLPEENMKKIIVLGTFLCLVSGSLLFLVIDIWIFVIAMVLSGLGVGFNYLGALYLAVSATEKEKGTHAGLIESMGGVGLFLGPILGGYLMEIDLSYPYLMWTVLSLVVFVLIIYLVRKDSRATL